MKKTIRLIVTSIGLFSIFACTKDLYELENENSFSKEKVEKWFETSFKESEQWKQNKAAQSSTPDWNQGTYVKKGKLEVYEFPLIEDKTTVTVPVIGKMTPENTSKVRSVLFSTQFRIAFVKTETGQIVVRKLYYVPDYEYLLSKEYDINEAVINKEGDDFTGTLITNNWNNKVLSYHRIANGKAVGQIKRINGAPPETDPNLQLNMKTYKRNSRMSARDMEGGWLNEVPVINDYHAPDYSGPKGDTYWGDATFGGGPSDNYDWDYDSCNYNCGGGSGSGTAISIPKSIVDKIDPTKLDPCTKAVYEKMKNTTNTDIAAMLTKFGVTSDYNVTMKMGSMKKSRDFAETEKISKNNYSITFTENTYKDVTKLYKATVIAHEIIHAYMLSVVDDYNTYPTNAPFTDFPELFKIYVNKTNNVANASVAQHNDMADRYVDAIASAIQEYQLNETKTPASLTDKQAFLDMAWSGLQGTDVYNKKFPAGSADDKRITARIGAETNGVYSQGQYAVGKPCN